MTCDIYELYCPFCKEDTDQEVTGWEHERDSSNEHRVCTICSAVYSGWSCKYFLNGEYRE